MDQVIDHREVVHQAVGHVGQLLLGMHVGHWRQGSLPDVVGVTLSLALDRISRGLARAAIRLGQGLDLYLD